MDGAPSTGSHPVDSLRAGLGGGMLWAVCLFLTCGVQLVQLSQPCPSPRLSEGKLEPKHRQSVNTQLLTSV